MEKGCALGSPAHKRLALIVQRAQAQKIENFFKILRKSKHRLWNSFHKKKAKKNYFARIFKGFSELWVK
jgi:hypothetical protein